MKTSTILAAAIASTIAGTAVADTSLYGNIRLELVNKTDLNMDSSKLVIGYKASEDMGNGMTGFMLNGPKGSPTLYFIKNKNNLISLRKINSASMPSLMLIGI